MCRAGGRRCDQKTALRKQIETARRSRNRNRAKAAAAAETSDQQAQERYEGLMAQAQERMEGLIAQDQRHDTAVERQAGGLAEAVRRNREAGLRKVLDVPMVDVAPASVRHRLEAPEFKALLDDERSTRARLDQVEAEGSTASAAERHQALDAHRAVKKRLLDYRIETASMLGEAETVEADLPQREGTVRLGEAEAGSSEWLKMRQPTLGGSDVGAITKVGTWGGLDYDKCRDAHMNLDPEDQDHSGASWVGDQWEPHLIRASSGILGEEVYTNKGTYSDGKRHANLDGFTLDEDGEVRAVVESKTASDPAAWEERAPDGYVLQTEHYMDFYGAKEGIIVVNINDERLVAYRVEADDKVPAGPRSIKKLGEEFSYGDVREYAEGMVAKWNEDREKVRSEGKPNTPRRRFKVTPEDEADWGEMLDRGAVFVDLETTHVSASRGHVIEFAGTDEGGAEMERLYGVPDDHAEWNGTGPVEVHQIDGEMVAGKPVLLEDASSAEEIKAFVGDRVLVAHNARFEETWLKEAGIKVRTVDSMKVFGALVDGEHRDNSMSSLTAWAGVEYRDAHRAGPDARMLRDAFARLKPLMEKHLGR